MKYILSFIAGAVLTFLVMPVTGQELVHNQQKPASHVATGTTTPAVNTYFLSYWQQTENSWGFNSAVATTTVPLTEGQQLFDLEKAIAQKYGYTGVVLTTIIPVAK